MSADALAPVLASGELSQDACAWLTYVDTHTETPEQAMLYGGTNYKITVAQALAAESLSAQMVVLLPDYDYYRDGFMTGPGGKTTLGRASIAGLECPNRDQVVSPGTSLLERFSASAVPRAAFGIGTRLTSLVARVNPLTANH